MPVQAKRSKAANGKAKLEKGTTGNLAQILDRLRSILQDEVIVNILIFQKIITV